MATNYEQYRANKIESGLIFQDFVIDTCASLLSLHIQQYASRLYQYEVGETRQGCEIKHDELYAKTGNLWIEKSEKARPRPGDYAKSGIYRADNSWLFIIGDYDTLFIFQTNILRGLAECGRYREMENKTRTSVGFLLPSEDACKYAGKILNPHAAIKVSQYVASLEGMGRQLHAVAMRDERQKMLFSDDELDKLRPEVDGA